jgi:ribokinase
MPRVIVCGSLHYDIAVEGSDWPQKGETAVGRAWFPKLGGKGRNQAVSARKAGAEVDMIGRIGDDDFGRDLAADLTARGIGTAHLSVSPSAGSGMSVALFDPSGDYRAVIVSGSNLELSARHIPPAAFWADAGVLVLENEVPESANLMMAQAARAAGVRVLLNAAPYRPFSTALGATLDILVVNAIEASALAGCAEPEDLATASRAASLLARDFAEVIVTVGGAGLAYAKGTECVALAARSVAVVNTHGAGDAFVGALAAALAGGTAIRDALEMATDAAAALISTPEAERG